MFEKICSKILEWILMILFFTKMEGLQHYQKIFDKKIIMADSIKCLWFIAFA